jgi:uncharacterized membrane protein YvbJ
MFCSKCGNKLTDDAQFCAKCGTALNTVQDSANQATAEIQESNQDSLKPAKPKKKKSKLLLIAIIIAPVLLIITSLLLLIRYTSNSFFDDYFEEAKKIGIEYPTEKRDEVKKFVKEENVKDTIKLTGIGLLVLAIPTLLTVIGQRKNNIAMILIAGIVYILTIFGIPSAVMCFIAYAKMKKLASV